MGRRLAMGRCVTAILALVQSAVCLAQLADSVWPAYDGDPRRCRSLPLRFGTEVEHVITLGYKVGGGRYLCDEYGSVYCLTYGGLTKRGPDLEVVWKQPDAGQPLVLRADGSLIAEAPGWDDHWLVLVAPDGSILKSTEGEFTWGHPCMPDGGCFAAGNGGWTRLSPNLTPMYSMEYDPWIDASGNVWVRVTEASGHYLVRLDDRGAEAERLDITAYCEGPACGRLVGIGSGPTFYLLTRSGTNDWSLVSLGHDMSLRLIYDEGSVGGTWEWPVLVNASGDVYFTTGYSDWQWQEVSLHRVTRDGEHTILKRFIGGDPDYCSLSVGGLFTDASRDLFYWHGEWCPWQWSRGIELIDASGHSIAGVGESEYDKCGWGFHPDGFWVLGTEWCHDMYCKLRTYFLGPPTYLRVTADVQGRIGTAADIDYKFVARADNGTHVTRRGLQPGPFTWEYHTAPGTFAVEASSDYTLTSIRPVELTSDFAEVSFELVNGDVYDDNAIDIRDLVIELLFPVDLNNDGAAGSADLMIIFQNFGRVGDS
jgi:hypothetical protein